MAVFTPVTPAQLANWLTAFELGEVIDFRGIASGIENTNYFLTTRGAGGQPDEHVLTIFERLDFDQLPFYLYLMEHLARHDVPVPAPLPGRDGALLRPLHGKPACLVTRLPGRSVLAPQAMHCAQVGATMARMHLAGRDYPRTQPNLRSLPWWRDTVPQILPFLDAPQAALLQAEMAFQEGFFASGDYAALPAGPSHCDLFRDNVLFDTDAAQGDRLGGFFDFYFAGCDKWLFDIAVAVNDWCVDLASGALDAARVEAFLDGYRRVRPLTAEECACWQAMLRAGALRFWISRLWDFHLPRDAEMLQAHDPRHFERILRARIATPPAVLSVSEGA